MQKPDVHLAIMMPHQYLVDLLKHAGAFRCQQLYHQNIDEFTARLKSTQPFQLSWQLFRVDCTAWPQAWPHRSTAAHVTAPLPVPMTSTRPKSRMQSAHVESTLGTG